MSKFRYFALAVAIAAPTAALACNPSAMLEGGGGSVNYKSALDGSSNCFVFNGLVDASGAALFPNVAALANGSATPTTARIGALMTGYNGTTWDFLTTVVGTGALKTDMSSINGTATITGGVAGLQAMAGPVASGGSNADNPLKVGGVFNTTQPTVTTGQIVDSQYTARGASIIATGVDPVTVQPGNTANTTPWLMQEVPNTSGGLSWYFLQPIASDNHTVVANGAHQLYEVVVNNNSSIVNYLRFYDLGTGFNGCNSATGLKGQIPIPASTAIGGQVIPIVGGGASFATGISICVTSGYATNDVTNATATAMSINILYK